jgi:AcrR family transcriptional regulator
MAALRRAHYRATMPSPQPSASVQPPQQERSRRTLEKICQATEKLLATRAFDDIGVADIVREARCSTGSFYARFASKDDLLPYLYQRYDADLRPRIEARVATLTIDGLTLRETAQLVVDTTVELYAERRHLLRAVALYARTRPRDIDAETRRVRESVTDMPPRVLARFAEEIVHEDALEAARVGWFVVSAACREKILFGEAPHAASLRLSLDRLKGELGRLLYAYLTTR